MIGVSAAVAVVVVAVVVTAAAVAAFVVVAVVAGDQQLQQQRVGDPTKKPECFISMVVTPFNLNNPSQTFNRYCINLNGHRHTVLNELLL